MASLGETVAALARSRSATMPPTSSSRRLRRTETFGVNRGGLRMLTYTPEALAPGAALVVVLHGCTQTAVLNLSDRRKYAVAANLEGLRRHLTEFAAAIDVMQLPPE